MALDENLLFKTLFENRGDRSIEDIMRDVAKAKAAFAQAETDLASQQTETSSELDPNAAGLGKKEFEIKRLTRRNLIEEPETAITDDSITCCLCGKQMKILSAAHLKCHGTTPELYRKLCGYSEEQKLMSHKRAEQMVEMVKIAQANRKCFKNKAENVG
ncbi:MAG: MucR family transcriptional regulator [Desulfovibrio sp.]|nr:MucR family transcriptional regulator [Desulfovibrio sp.]